MVKQFARAASVLTETTFLIKVAIAAFTLIATVSAFYAGSKSMINMPGALAKHDSVTISGFRSIDKMLCIQVADHRKMDWHLCYINPTEVLPKDNANY